jgi:hypothetical protein
MLKKYLFSLSIVLFPLPTIDAKNYTLSEGPFIGKIVQTDWSPVMDDPPVKVGQLGSPKPIFMGYSGTIEGNGVNITCPATLDKDCTKNVINCAGLFKSEKGTCAAYYW